MKNFVDYREKAIFKYQEKIDINMPEVEEIEDKDYEFYINADLSEYAGKWIAIVDGRVVASGDRADKVINEVKRNFPGKKFLITKVPEPGLLILEAEI